MRIDLCFGTSLFYYVILDPSQIYVPVVSREIGLILMLLMYLMRSQIIQRTRQFWDINEYLLILLLYPTISIGIIYYR
jgi:hypothetical protein